jgi:oligoribonuclease
METENELDYLVLVDIETTGLADVFPDDVVCEVGLKVVDRQLRTWGEFSSLVLNENWRAKMARGPFVWNMHTESGLIKELDDIVDQPHFPGQYTPKVVAVEAYKWLTETMGLPPGKMPMMGSSVQFDREFLNREMIVLEKFFTYRNIDVSTLKELCMRFNSDLYVAIKNEFKKEDAKHRVLPDLEATLSEFRVYLDNFLFVPGNAIGTGDFVEDENQPAPRRHSRRHRLRSRILPAGYRPENRRRVRGTVRPIATWPRATSSMCEQSRLHLHPSSGCNPRRRH